MRAKWFEEENSGRRFRLTLLFTAMTFIIENAEYHRSWLAQFFHSFPHVDLSFESTNANFTPQSGKYREALGFWAGIPVIWCGILWLAFLIFFCYRCCSKSQIKQSRATCARLGAALFMLCGCGALVVAFYGNAQVHSGMEGFVGAVNSVNKTIEGSLGVIPYYVFLSMGEAYDGLKVAFDSKVTTLDRLANDTERNALPELTEAISSIANVTIHTKIGDLLNQILTNIKSALTVTVSLEGDAQKVDTEEIVNTTDYLEHYRWMITILVNCIYIVIFLLSFTALVKKSRWMLILAAVLSIICMLVVFSMMSFYVFIGIGGGDLCVDPDQFVMSEVNGTVQKDVLLAFMKCEDSSKPYQEDILNAQTAVTQAITALNMTVNMTLPFNISDKISGPVKHLRNNLKFMFGNLSALTAQVGSCEAIHEDYVTALQGICYAALEGVGYLVLFSFLVGMSSALMVVCSAKAWPHYGKRRRARASQHYTRVDDSDPFLPDPPPYERNYGTMRQASVTAESRLQSDTVMINEEDRPIMQMGQQGETPPPAYQAGHYMQQYYSLAPTPSSVAQSSNSNA